MVNSNDKETLMIEKIDSSYPLLPLISFCSKSLDDPRPFFEKFPITKP
jgi:hypothetical protein